MKSVISNVPNSTSSISGWFVKFGFFSTFRNDFRLTSFRDGYFCRPVLTGLGFHSDDMAYMAHIIYHGPYDMGQPIVKPMPSGSDNLFSLS